MKKIYLSLFLIQFCLPCFSYKEIIINENLIVRRHDITEKDVEEYKKSQEKTEDALKLADDYYYGNNGKKADAQRALYWYKIAAENTGDKEACYRFAYSFENPKAFGNPEEERDIKKAIYWYEKAASKKHLLASMSLGDLYFKGKLISKDYKKALKWYEKALKDHKSKEAKKQIKKIHRLTQGKMKKNLFEQLMDQR